jgi:hypothetical protein
MKNVFFSLLSVFWKNKRRLMRSPCCLYVCVSPFFFAFYAVRVVSKDSRWLVLPPNLMFLFLERKKIVSCDHWEMTGCVPFICCLAEHQAKDAAYDMVTVICYTYCGLRWCAQKISNWDLARNFRRGSCRHWSMTSGIPHYSMRM